ncbi:MAG: hypothetical protein SynsKO_34660 [Synoicihabitans sp.]
MPSQSLFAAAISLHEQTQYRFYDALIVAAAIESGAPKRWTEDLRAGRRLNGLKIENPFGG